MAREWDMEHAFFQSPHVLRLIAGLLFNRPLMIEQTELDFILCMLAPRIGIQPPSIEGRLRATKVERKIPGTDRTATTAIIPVHGALVNRRMGSAMSGGPTTYAEIREAHKAAMEDSSIARLLYHFDTGGGEVAGAFDTAKMIFDSRGKKPIDAFIDESAYSAGYLLASAADRIFTSLTGGAGSIGVRAVFRSQQAKDMAEGYKFETIKFGTAKADFDPHEPLGERARATLQAQVNEIGEMFVDTVAQYRKMDRKKVRDMEAGIFQGRAAKDIGLVDDFMSFDEAMMLENDQREEVFSMAAEEQILAMLQDMGGKLTAMSDRLIKLETGNPEVTSANPVPDGAVDYRYDILNACLAVGHMLGGADKARELAAELNKESVSLAEAHNRIIARVSESRSKEEIRSSVGPEGYGDVNPLDAACDKLVAQTPKRKAA